MKSIQLAVFALLFATNLIFGQTYINTPEKPFIEVNGTAEKEINPDEIYIRIIIREKTENRDKMSVEEQEKNLIEAIKSLGIDLVNLTVTDANADYMRVGWGKREVVEKKDFTLLVNDAKSVGLVFEKLDELEIREAYISKVDHSKIEEFRKEVKIKAIQAAKEKASYLTAAIDEKLGAPQIIRENIHVANPYANYKLEEYQPKILMVGSFSNEGDNKDVLQFQKITVSSSIYVKFGIGN